MMRTEQDRLKHLLQALRRKRLATERQRRDAGDEAFHRRPAGWLQSMVRRHLHVSSVLREHTVAPRQWRLQHGTGCLPQERGSIQTTARSAVHPSTKMVDTTRPLMGVALPESQRRCRSAGSVNVMAKPSTIGFEWRGEFQHQVRIYLSCIQPVAMASTRPGSCHKRCLSRPPAPCLPPRHAQLPLAIRYPSPVTEVTTWPLMTISGR